MQERTPFIRSNYIRVANIGFYEGSSFLHPIRDYRPEITIFGHKKSARRRKRSSGPLICADRSETETIELRARDWARNKKKDTYSGILFLVHQARDGTRTRGPNLGKVVLYQLSHSRIVTGKTARHICYYTCV